MKIDKVINKFFSEVYGKYLAVVRAKREGEYFYTMLLFEDQKEWMNLKQGDVI